MLSVEFSGQAPGLSRIWLRRLLAQAYRLAGGRGQACVAVVIVNDRLIRRLNRAYRRQDRPTDVLSFDYAERPFGPPARRRGRDTAPRELGDIVISAERVRRQAKAAGRPFRQEFSLALVHGLLHLLGFDHATARQKKIMFGLQQEILMRAKVF